MNRRQETAAVKAALVKAGIPIRHVKHGTGTACGWLNIYLKGVENSYLSGNARVVIEIAQRVTGRHGEYDGKINVH